MRSITGAASDAGLMITQASQISQQGSCHDRTPGMYTDQQVAGWRLVTDAVHKRGGRIFAQLWHVGRASHNAFQPGGARLRFGVGLVLPGRDLHSAGTATVSCAAGGLRWRRLLA